MYNAYYIFPISRSNIYIYTYKSLIILMFKEKKKIQRG